MRQVIAIPADQGRAARVCKKSVMGLEMSNPPRSSWPNHGPGLSLFLPAIAEG
jgi:hypothetical protein